jgi:hypothetical protein
MVKQLLALLLGCVVISMTGCIIQSAPAGLEKEQIYTAKLANGAVIKYGYKEPDDAWHCQTVLAVKYNWALQRFKGKPTVRGGHEHLAKVAIQNINKNGIKANYFYMLIPTEVDVIGIDVTMLKKAQVIYYQCQYLGRR